MSGRIVLGLMLILGSSGCSSAPTCSSQSITNTVIRILDDKLKQENTFMGVHEYDKSSLSLSQVHTINSGGTHVSCAGRINFHAVYTQEWGQVRNVIPSSGNNNIAYDISYEAYLTDNQKETLVKITQLQQVFN